MSLSLVEIIGFATDGIFLLLALILLIAQAQLHRRIDALEAMIRARTDVHQTIEYDRQSMHEAIEKTKQSHLR